MKKYLTIDVGGSSIKWAVIDEELNFLDKGKVPNTFKTLDEYTDAIAGLYNAQSGVEGLACSMPGVIDPDTGFMYSGGAYDGLVHGINLIDELHKKIDCKISIGNDAKCAAYAELGYGSLKDAKDAVVIVLGSAIGGCIIIDRKVLNGKHFSAGEFSGISLNCISDEPFTANIWAGRNGSRGLRARVNEAMGNEEKYDGLEIFEMINNGNESAKAGLRKFCQELAYELYSISTMLDPDKFAIGGGISSQKVLFEVLDEELQKVQDSLPFYVKIEKPVVVPCEYNNDANLIGALYHFQTKFEK